MPRGKGHPSKVNRPEDSASIDSLFVDIRAPSLRGVLSSLDSVVVRMPTTLHTIHPNIYISFGTGP